MNKLFLLVALTIAISGCAQNSAPVQNKSESNTKKVGGGCEGCEAIFESPVPFAELSWIDTLPDYNEPGPKLVVSGTVFKADGQTPAPNVILYVYHTDQRGVYSTKGTEKGWGKRHGYIRGWMKTNQEGQYKFHTLRPASYPGRKDPAHIHPTVKEDGLSEYWIDDFLFDDDSLLTTAARQQHQERGGNGILKLEKRDGIYYAERNIYLGKNIPDYPR